jgi:hypothetical protein
MQFVSSKFVNSNTSTDYGDDDTDITVVTSINLLHVSTPDCHPKEGFPIKGVEDQHTNLVMHGILRSWFRASRI